MKASMKKQDQLILDENGNSLGQKDQTQIQLKILDEVLSVSNDLFFMFDQEGKCIYASQSAQTEMALYGSHVLGEQWNSLPLLKSKLGPFSECTKYVFRESRKLNGDFESSTQGQLKYYEYQINPVRNESGDVSSLVLILRDITEKRISEEQLRGAFDIANRASAAKSQFLANMSHEIRTPLNAIVGVADLLCDTELSLEQRRFVTIFRRASASLLAIVNDILDLSKIEADKLTLETIDFDLHDVIADVVDLFKNSAIEKNIHLTYQIDPEVHRQVVGDPNRLRQVISNLIGNAIKFTNRGEVSLLVKRNDAPEHKGNLYFEVRDTGAGIHQEKLKSLFQAFSQVDASITRKYGGTGLGLIISKKIVELMGGDIWVNSVIGVGTQFYFTVNCSASEKPLKADAKKTAQNVEQANSRTLKILLADDSEDNRLLVTAFLRGTPHELVQVENGSEAVDRYKKEKFDLVFMDVQMPIMDGLSAVKLIRMWEKEKTKTPSLIVALTAHALKVEEEKSYKAGCDYHFTKPINKSNLLAFVSKVASGEI